MGFLTEGDTLVWEDSIQHHAYVKKSGTKQLCYIFQHFGSKKYSGQTWGDEVEYLLIEFNDEERTVKLKLRGDEVLHNLQQPEINKNPNIQALWRPEYGSFMIEGTPADPYTYDISSLCSVQENMRTRRSLATDQLHENEYVITLPNFPLLGSGDFTSPSASPGGQIAGSLFTPDECINPHKRFGTLTNNIKRRRGSNVAINMPLYMDTKTEPLTYSHLFPGQKNIPALENHIYMDSMAFGMGQCCLQTTFQTVDVEEGRFLYDQYLPLTPIFLALTAATPIFRGYLSDVDVRWNVISQSVDDRKKEELGLVEGSDVSVIDKSRYASVSLFIDENASEEFNDIDVVINQEIYNDLIDQNIDPKLARHFAHLFIRDPLVIYDKKIEIDDKLHSDHFENIQSTNWQTARFKPPAPGSTYGWRIEFRPMEIQLTDFENAAFAVFIAITTRIILDKRLSWYMPISQIDENMERAHHRGASQNEKFWFKSDSGVIKQFSVNEIINGCDDFTGLVPLVREYITENEMEEDQRNLLNSYVDLVSKRASGELMNAATWIRKFVTEHSEYKQDSVVSESIAYDLLKTIVDIETGETSPPEGFL